MKKITRIARSLIARPLPLTGLLFALALFRTLPAQSAGRFDYYVLALSWAPEFCSQQGASAAADPLECAPGRGLRFVIHGLWPQANEGRGPESCGPAKTLARGLVNSMLPYMPSPSLIRHEWVTHGTCTGLTPGDYFTKLMLARAAVQIPVQIASIGETATEGPAQMEAQFAGANPSFPGGAFRIACRSGAFSELRVCFDKGLKARACTASVGECGAPTVTIRPPR